MCGIYAGEDISDIERFIIFIFLLCYYYTGIDKQILNHSISFPHNLIKPREDTWQRGCLFALHNIRIWDIIYKHTISSIFVKNANGILLMCKV